jgi:amino-acid N-acetyltransferase
MQASTNVRLERATVKDGPAILYLLAHSGLPTDGLVEHLGTAIVARGRDRIVGCAALEVYADAALLRSVAVANEAKRGGIGTELTSAALDLATTLGVRAVYLLTTTAAEFFSRLSFEPISRQDVPSAVQRSVEFQSACPASAIVMRKQLSAHSEPSQAPTPPVVCTLQSGELDARAAELLPGLGRLASGMSPLKDGYRFAFVPSREVLSTISTAIDAERRCCPFLRFEVTTEADDGQVRLDVTGPPGTTAFLRSLLETE